MTSEPERIEMETKIDTYINNYFKDQEISHVTKLIFKDLIKHGISMEKEQSEKLLEALMIYKDLPIIQHTNFLTFSVPDDVGTWNVQHVSPGKTDLSHYAKQAIDNYENNNKEIK